MNLATLQEEVEFLIPKAPSGTILYLEGKSDVEFLFALLGLAVPIRDGLGNLIHQGVLVKDCDSKRGSGSAAVKARVDVAGTIPHSGRVFGIIDGDGSPLHELAPNFDPPFPGPLFSWKAYCIENLLVKTGWPPAWGDEPDWVVELSRYAPYVALNRIGREVRATLRALGLEKYTLPILGEPLKQPDEIAAALASGKDGLLKYDVETRFGEELSVFEATVNRGLDEAHAMLNGKWLVRHLAPAITKRDPDHCQYEWLNHSRAVGGLPEVREWWERIIGSPP
jgi:hypothetical protein